MLMRGYGLQSRNKDKDLSKGNKDQTESPEDPFDSWLDTFEKELGKFNHSSDQAYKSSESS